MTLAEFAGVFALLAVQLRYQDADEATIRSYYEALKDLDLELIQMAAKRFGETAEYFPKSSEWRTLTGRIEGERADQLRAVLRKLTTPLCLSCSDTGWELVPTTTNRWRHCACRKLRRLEILGVRPFPQVPQQLTA